jgi:hypothetical protein
MGRPIKKRFFGSTISPYRNFATGGKTGVGGEGVASVTLSPTSLAVSTLTVTVAFTAPTITGGITATGTPVKTGNTVTSVVITNAGSGYLTAPTVSFTGTNMTSYVGAGTAVLTANRQDTISIISYLPSASQSRTNGDILKQESSRRYLVQNADGKGVCTLTTGVLTKGKMHIIATDFGGATYYVTKLSARKATVVNRTNTSTAYVKGGSVKWTIGAATGTGVNTVISLAHTI